MDNRRKKGVILSEIAFAGMPVIFKNVGFDCFIIDYEHGGFDYGAVADVIRTAMLTQLPAYVRLAGCGRKDILKFLDMGASGLILPMTSDAGEIEEIVKCAKYPPQGRRGVSTTRGHTLYSHPDMAAYMPQANAGLHIFAQIESQVGIENLDRILAVPGVTGCILGPNDFAAELCLHGEAAERAVLAAIERLAKAGRAAKKHSGIISASDSYLRQAAACGMAYIFSGSELSMLNQAGREIVKRIEGLTGDKR